MSVDFDEFPTYDPLIKPNTDIMSQIWASAITTFHQTLISYLSSSGVFLPQLTTERRDAIQSPQNGQMIYNTTTDEPQIWQVKAGIGAWRVFTTTP